MKLLLDTNVISDFVRGVESVQQRLRSTAPADIAVSTVTVMEISFGLARSAPRARRIAPVVEALLAAVTTLDYGDGDARETGHIRAELELLGRSIGLCDAMLAGVARSRNLTMVTHNLSEFSRVDGLRVADWREG